MTEHVGSITFCRIYSGKLEQGMALANTTRDKKERAGRMYLMHAADLGEAYASGEGLPKDAVKAADLFRREPERYLRVSGNCRTGTATKPRNETG